MWPDVDDDLRRRIAQLEKGSEDLQDRCAEFARRDRAADARHEQRMQSARQALFLGHQHLGWRDDEPGADAYDET
ncbi:hypothetical protein HLB42_20870 (plasmid) [Deinococcus sp. D7000]|nr:hypothetical protein HLB42_20870 [Deinococcus sp. D7000]